MSGRGRNSGGGRTTGSGGSPGGRHASVRVRSSRGRTESSRRWLERQLNDPYVREANRLGYRSRSAFKLLELDDRFNVLRPGARVVDLGAAPGGWTQVAVKRVRAGRPDGGRVVAFDLLPMEPIEGADVIEGDFLDDAAANTLMRHLDGRVDVVLSDLAPATTGHAGADHLRIMALAEAAYDFAEAVLAERGTFVCKVFQGGTESGLLARIKRRFANVRHAKPPASRAESAEIYLVASKFRSDTA